MNKLLRIMEGFMAFFIAITGVTLMPQVSEISSGLNTFLYGLSIIFSSVYFLYLSISNKFLNKQEMKNDGRDI